MTQEKDFKPVPVKAAIAIEDLEKIYADGLKPVLAIPENRVPDGARAG